MRFIKALWGDQDSRNYGRVKDAVSNYAAAPERSMESGNCVVYCFGSGNQKLVSDIGLETRLLDDCHEPHWYGSGPNWTHKVDAIAAGIEEFGEVIWMDWDMRQLEPLDDKFWKEVRGRGPFQSGLTRYRRAYANWRGRHEDRNCLPGGGWLYFCGGDFTENLIDLIYKFLPRTKNRKGEYHYHDEYAMAMAIEEIHGGWKGVDWWNENYQPTVLLHPRGAIESSRERGGKYFKTH